jgi:hypothetical protein
MQALSEAGCPVCGQVSVSRHNGMVSTLIRTFLHHLHL